MSYMIEGNWDEIKRHEGEFLDRRLKVTISDTPKREVTDDLKSMPPRKTMARVSAMGKYAGILSSEEFMRFKQEDIALEYENPK